MKIKKIKGIDDHYLTATDRKAVKAAITEGVLGQWFKLSKRGKHWYRLSVEQLLSNGGTECVLVRRRRERTFGGWGDSLTWNTRAVPVYVQVEEVLS